MATRRAMQGALGGFLGTYTSRNTDHDGYWLFGFLDADLIELRIDLLVPPVVEIDSPLWLAVRTAVAQFQAQVRKARVDMRHVREACLEIRRLPATVAGSINGHPCKGNDLSFSTWVVMDNGRRFEKEQEVFVAPHDARIELRSARAG